MNSEREIIKRLMESKDLDEKTYTVGDTQYWKRGGKCYSWTASGGRVECSEEEYMKAISGGTGDSPKNTDPKDDKSNAPTKQTNSSASMEGDKATIDMNGYKYTAKVNGMTDQEVVDKYNSIAKHSPGKAIQWIKNHGTLDKVSDKSNAPARNNKSTDTEKSSYAKDLLSKAKSNGNENDAWDLVDFLYDTNLVSKDAKAQKYLDKAKQTNDIKDAWKLIDYMHDNNTLNSVNSKDKLSNYNSMLDYGAAEFVKVIPQDTENGTIDQLVRSNGISVYGTTDANGEVKLHSTRKKAMEYLSNTSTQSNPVADKYQSQSLVDTYGSHKFDYGDSVPRELKSNFTDWLSKRFPKESKKISGSPDFDVQRTYDDNGEEAYRPVATVWNKDGSKDYFNFTDKGWEYSGHKDY